MLNEIYHQLMIMSAVASGLYLILKLLSILTLRYFSASWHYYTNIMIYSFFLIPYHKLFLWFSLHFKYPLDHRLTLSPITSLSRLNPFGSVDDIPFIDRTAMIPSIILDFLPYLMILGIVIFITVILIQNYRLNRRILESCRLTDNRQILEVFATCKQKMGISKKIPVYISLYPSTPFLYGIFKPRVVLPDIHFTQEELQHIFIHELTHWKRHDTWLKLLMVFVHALHWFNPFAYMARRDIDHYSELSCDERVVKSMNHQERKQYCELMLGVLWNVTDYKVKLFSAFSDKRNLERRINMVLKNKDPMQKKRMNIFAGIISLLIMILGTVTAYAASNTIQDYSDAGAHFKISSKKISWLDMIEHASDSTVSVDALFGGSDEKYVIENDVIIYSKIYNSFEETKKIGDESFPVTYNGYTGYVSAKSAYRIGNTDKFIFNCVGKIRY